jgi:hypothetical protein
MFAARFWMTAFLAASGERPRARSSAVPRSIAAAHRDFLVVAPAPEELAHAGLLEIDGAGARRRFERGLLDLRTRALPHRQHHLLADLRASLLGLVEDDRLDDPMRVGDVVLHLGERLAGEAGCVAEDPALCGRTEQAAAFFRGR